MSTPSQRADTVLNGFIANFMEAIVTSGNSVQGQMNVDAQTTLNFGNLEQEMNQLYYSNAATDPNHTAGGGLHPGADWNLQDWVAQVEADAANGGNNTSSYVTADQMGYNKLSSQASGVTSYLDTLTSSSNTMTTNDSNNFSQLMQLAQTMNLMGFVAQLLAKG